MHITSRKERRSCENSTRRLIESRIIEPATHSWASADFFPGEGKIFQGGQKHTICLKAPKNILFSSKKVKKTYYFGRPGGDQGPPLALPCGRPCTHCNEILLASIYLNYTQKTSVYWIIWLLLSF